MRSRACRGCRRQFLPPVRRGRPPVRCAECGGAGERVSSAPEPVKEAPPEPVKEAPPEPFPAGVRVRVCERYWHGVRRPSVTGVLRAWHHDKVGLYGEVWAREGRLLARPQHIQRR